MSWTRRSMLRALGASAAAALAPMAGCGSAARTAVFAKAPEIWSLPRIRQDIRAAVAELSRHHAPASALAILRTARRVAADAGEHGAEVTHEASVVLCAGPARSRLEHVVTDPRSAAILEAARALAASAPARDVAGHTADTVRPERFASRPSIDPARTSAPAWIERARDLYERSRRVGGSRIVYRGAYLAVDDCTSLFVSEDRELVQRIVRSRAGVVLVAQGSARGVSVPVAEIAEQSSLAGLEVTNLADAMLADAARRALVRVTPTAPPSGMGEVVLAPSVAARIAYDCVAAALRGDLWARGQARAAALRGQAVDSELITLIDDPGDASGFGSYFFDDEGERARRLVLIERGVLVGPVTDAASAAVLGLPRTGHGRRLGPSEPVAPRSSNVAIAPGAASRGELMAAVPRGLLLDGVLDVHVDLRSWRFVATVARGYEIARGKLTGVLYGPVTVRGDVPALLQAVQAVSAESERFTAVGDVPGTMASPYLLTRAEVIS